MNKTSEGDGLLWRFDGDWPDALGELSAEMHTIDRDACWIWFQFFPLALKDLLDATPDRKVLEQVYQFRGTYQLADIPDTSHRFLYGHRYWPAVKRALVPVMADEPKPTLVETIRSLAARLDGPSDLTLAISAVGLMTLRQVGPDFLTRPYSRIVGSETAEQVLRSRATNAKRGLFGRSKPRVVMDEGQSDGWFPLVPGQHITTAAELDKRPHHETNRRCSIGNGPIPVDCRSGTCGTCWVGILGGNEKLDPVEPFERKRMEYFGYWENPFHRSDDLRPLIRLACQCVARGSCGIVIPPWNGVWSRKRQEAVARRT